MTAGRRLIALGLVAALALTLAASAAAKSFDLNFDRASGRPGTAVTARSNFLVYPALARVLPSVVVYLIPTRLGHADYNMGWSVLPPPGSRHTYRLGTMTQKNRRLFLRFAIPRVPPGDYMTASWCPPRICGETAWNFSASTLWGSPWTRKPGAVIRVTR
jgi:hypothetical protein